MSTRDDPKKVSDRSTRYLHREEKKEDLEDPQERDQKKGKGKGKGKRPVPLLPMIAPPQTSRPANSPSTHEAYVWKKLASIPVDAHLLPLDELTTKDHPTSPQMFSSSLFAIPGDSRVFHTLLDILTEDTARVQTVVQNFEDLFANTSTSLIRPTILFRDSNSERSSGGTSRGEGSGGDSPSPSGSPRGGPPFPPNPPGGGGGLPYRSMANHPHPAPFTKHFYPKFKGRGDGDDADSYIKLFESVSITNKEDNDDDRMRIFPSLLQKKARSWYNHESTIPTGIDSWAKLREKFLKRFRELGYDSRVLTKLRNLQRERKENLKDYTERFQDLLDRIPKTGEGVPYSTQQTIDWCDTIDDVIVSAQAYETSTLNRRPKDRPREERKSKGSRKKRRTSTPSSSESSSSSEESEPEDSCSFEDKKVKKKDKKKKNRRMIMSEKGALAIVSKVDALAKEFADLKVHVVGSRDKRKSPTGVRSNLWCTNSGRVGHANVECRPYQPVNTVEWVPAWKVGGNYTEAPEETAYIVQEGPPITPIQ
ncbi:hypothetical protein AXG93_2891s1100 [Marchantia polymorpha subsp. ruderalis]|uniref:Retrotransposon gag domain-containing protein n=1 Tax=Marchantia polymorpha subsp. ruderalis TaxID=1480154 RepID=A0A176WPA6_MARPO|nr:hypothetical protein AXG93_2891s1100 [Marchantia polymorpha subsp. ruderalis]